MSDWDALWNSVQWWRFVCQFIWPAIAYLAFAVGRLWERAVMRQKAQRSVSPPRPSEEERPW